MEQSNKAFIVGVMGGGSASDKDMALAFKLGELIAKEGWILLNGGRNAGIMEASAKGAFESGGMTVGILPDADNSKTSPYIRIPVLTGMGSARNSINVLSSDFVVACPGGAGTLSEIALALKSGKTVILLNFDVKRFFENVGGEGRIFFENTPEAVVRRIKDIS